jgi:hypothetical protein
MADDVRECECGGLAWSVVKCAHFDGEVVRLEDWSDFDVTVEAGAQFVVWSTKQDAAMYYGPRIDPAKRAFDKAIASLGSKGEEGR